MNQLNTEKRVTIGSLSIDPALEALVREEIIPGLGWMPRYSGIPSPIS